MGRLAPAIGERGRRRGVGWRRPNAGGSGPGLGSRRSTACSPCSPIRSMPHSSTSAPRLRVISQVAVGLDNIDLAACTRRGIPVGYTPDVLTDTTADTAIGLLLAAGRRLVEGARMVAAGEWQRWAPDLLLGNDLHHTVLGVVGMGRIGRAVGRRALGFGMEVVYTGPNPAPRSRPGVGCASTATRRDCSPSPTMSSSPPRSTEATRHIIDREALRSMKPSAVLVNVARGGLVDQSGPCRGARFRRHRRRRARCDRPRADRSGRPFARDGQLRDRPAHRQCLCHHPCPDERACHGESPSRSGGGEDAGVRQSRGLWDLPAPSSPPRSGSGGYSTRPRRPTQKR